MARMNRTNLLSDTALNRLKYEVAEEIGLMDKVQSIGWGDMTSRECGRVGGHIGGNMVKVMIRYAEQALADGAKLPR